MKTILVLTDLSNRSDHTAQYALKLAQKVKANLLLCNIFPIPIDPEHFLGAGLATNFESLEKDSIAQLTELGARLNKKLDAALRGDVFRPAINHSSEAGIVADVVRKVTIDHNLLMAVIGVHAADSITTFLVGDHANEIIENSKCPVLVVPYQLPFTNFNKISFASDLTHTGRDILNCLYGLTKHFDSEILITHVTDENSMDINEPDIINNFFNPGSTNITYPRVHYRTIKNRSITAGLDWMAEHTDIDLLVLVHRKRNFFQKIFEESITQKLADHLIKPMLVIPGLRVHETLPVF
jgi:nucleotide-binding universal stress UspA family protein